MRQELRLDIDSGFRLLRLDRSVIRATCDAVRHLAEHSSTLSQPDVEWADTVNHTGMRSTDAKLESDS